MSLRGFKCIKKLFKFNEDFIKKYDKDSTKGYILEVDVEHPKKFFNLHSNLPFLAGRKKIEICKKFVIVAFMTKKTMLFT